MLSPRAIALQGIGFEPRLVAMQGLAPFTVTLPPVSGGGGGAAGVAGYKLPGATTYQDEERIRADIIREDEEVLAVLMGAVTSGALKWLH